MSKTRVKEIDTREVTDTAATSADTATDTVSTATDTAQTAAATDAQ